MGSRMETLAPEADESRLGRGVSLTSGRSCRSGPGLPSFPPGPVPTLFSCLPSFPSPAFWLPAGVPAGSTGDHVARFSGAVLCSPHAFASSWVVVSPMVSPYYGGRRSSDGQHAWGM